MRRVSGNGHRAIDHQDEGGRKGDCPAMSLAEDKMVGKNLEHRIRSSIEDLKAVSKRIDMGMRQESLRRGWQELASSFCNANAERSSGRQWDGMEGNGGDNDQKNELDSNCHQHNDRSNQRAADGGTIHFAPWAMGNLPRRLLCDCVAAEFDGAWGTTRTALELRRIAEVITKKWKPHENVAATDDDIDTSSDDYKMKIITLFFGAHLIRKRAFWRNVRALRLNEDNFVVFYEKIIEKAIRREWADVQSGRQAQVRQQHPTTRVCCLAPNPGLKYCLTIEPEDADFGEKEWTFLRPQDDTTSRHSNTAASTSSQLPQSRASVRSSPDKTPSVADRGSDEGSDDDPD
ncbi:hypothetical protein F5883DRAFT_702166 [Diaporthe sp. PMI_573]|nr:hypothetical protein F5883DRAFT_702166 [Diaporthaceae sp. PMI_573]